MVKLLTLDNLCSVLISKLNLETRLFSDGTSPNHQTNASLKPTTSFNNYWSILCFNIIVDFKLIDEISHNTSCATLGLFNV